MRKRKTTEITNPAASRLPKGLGDYSPNVEPPGPVRPKQITTAQAYRLGGRAKSTSGRKSL